MIIKILIGYFFFLAVFYGLVWWQMRHARTDVELWGGEED